MTVTISHYNNVQIDDETYDLLKEAQTKLRDRGFKLSIPKVIHYLVHYFNHGTYKT